MSIESEPEFLKQEIRVNLHNYRHEYAAGDLAHDYVSNKIFTGILGPFGVGKSTIVDEISLFVPAFNPINTMTTRGRKSEDPPGFMTADEGITFNTFRDAVNDEALINYSVIPDADIYGTLPEGFPDKYSLGPLLPASIEQIAKAGFEETHFIYIVAPGELWRGFVEKSRRHMSEDRFQSRVTEALDSIQFAKRNMNTLQFVENSDGKEGVARAANEIRKIVLTNATPSLPPDQAEAYLEEMRIVAHDLELH